MRFLIPLVALAACTDVQTPEEDNEQEVITTVELTIDSQLYVWTDPDNDGTPEVDPIFLSLGVHTASVRFLNALEDPPEDITIEVEAEAEQHQVFWEVPTNVSVSVTDQDANGLPLGLAATLDGDEAGAGTLTITLRHLPQQSGLAVKVDGLADTVASQGIEAIPGDSDARVSFDLEIEE
jgi:hypothetical protein